MDQSGPAGNLDAWQLRPQLLRRQLVLFSALPPSSLHIQIVIFFFLWGFFFRRCLSPTGGYVTWGIFPISIILFFIALSVRLNKARPSLRPLKLTDIL